jgi:hypothetical protein
MQGASLGDIESRQRELEILNTSIDDLNTKISGASKISGCALS